MGIPAYVPLLRHKQAEWIALSNCTVKTRKQIRPIIEAIPEMLERRPGAASRLGISTEALAVRNLWDLLAEESRRGAMLLDASLLANITPEAGGKALTLFDALAKRGPLPGVAPVVAAGAATGHLVSALHAATLNGTSVAVRLQSTNCTRAEFEVAFKTARRCASNARGVELIVDVQGSPDVTLVKSLLSKIQSFPWTRWTLLSGVFPENLAKYDPDAYMYRLSRREWICWRDGQATVAKSAVPAFGDYTIQHALYLPTVPLEGSQSVRYASQDDWLILRGRRASSFHKRGGTGSQYHAHARFLTRRAEFAGAGYSWGDREIASRAADPSSSPGGAPQWLAFGINHHLTHSAELVASVVS